MTNTCAICGRPTPDGWVDNHCVNRAAGHLAAIIELAGDARLVAAGLVRRGHGGAGGKPGSRPPLNDGATDVVDAVVNALTTLARDIAETRGIRMDSDGASARLSLAQSAQNGSGVPASTPECTEGADPNTGGSA